ncbi:ABC transporter ATP-binding protein [Tepidamorphus sp. 3E244]|uniref:ABC transporter ATP-binding protein n=1 Tax=Tepidamorphus sp. 3E244 TaxID=3385498 RepID=UPI0038FC8613
MPDTILNVENVHARYGLGDVLRGISLHVEAGEVVSLFGRNGVGKTTLLKTIAGWLKPHTGRIELAGETISGLETDKICHAGVGLVPEDRRIFPGLSVDENMRLGFRQSPSASAAERRERLEKAYERFPRLWERRQQMGTTLSGGEQQMLAIARVLVGAPKLVLIDEPTEGLAPFIVDEIVSIIQAMSADGMSVLLVEQNVHRALEVTSRFYAIERGAVVFEGLPDSEADKTRLFETIVAA